MPLLSIVYSLENCLLQIVNLKLAIFQFAYCKS